MTMIDGMREWLTQYTELAEQRIGVDSIDGTLESFAIYAESIPETLNTFFYARRRRRTFYLVRECPYGTDIAQNIENLTWYEDFSKWVYEQNKFSNMPDFGDKTECTAVSDDTAGALVAITEDGRAEYRIQLSVTYTERMF